MKKRRILGILLSCALLLAMIAACGNETTDTDQAPPPDDTAGTGEPVNDMTQQPPPVADDDAIYTLDFSDGNIDFVKVNLSPRKADARTAVEIMQLDGADALAISAPGGGEAHIGISLDELLGDKIADVKIIVMDIFAECPDGKFSAVSGNVTAKSGDAVVGSGSWSVYITTRNPNQAVLEFGGDNAFSTDGANLLEFSCTTNGPADKGETPAIIAIKNISFFDASNNGLAIRSGAGWAGPDNYGEGSGASAEISRWEIPADERVYDGEFLQYYTFGVDGKEETGVDDFMPHSVLNSSIGIEFEVDEFEGNTLVFIYFGAYNGWGWTQEDNVPVTYADGKVTLMWDDTGFDPAGPVAIDGEDDGLKLRFGNWGVPFNEMVKAAYLLGAGGGSGGASIDLPADERVYDGEFLQYYTFGVDGREEAGVDDFLPHSALNNSIGVEFDVTEFEGSTLVFIYFGAYNGWGWTQEDSVPVTYADGKVTLYWDDTGFDPAGPVAIDGEDDGLKLRFGNWGVDFASAVTAARLLMG